MEYRTIELSRGKVAKVSPEDYEYLMGWSWSAVQDAKSPDYWTVKRSKKKSDDPTLATSMGRVLLGLKKGNKLEVDHIDGDTLNNQRDNIRVATRSQNLMNRRVFKTSKTGHKGIALCPKTGKYTLAVKLAFDTLEEAEIRYKEILRASHGEYARSTEIS